MSEDLTCQNCGMRFDRPQFLTKHQQKFCVGSNYADITSLDKKFNSEFRNNLPISLPRTNMKATYDSEQLALEFERERLRAKGSAQVEYERLLEQIRREQQTKFDMNEEKEKLAKQLRSLEKQENGELAQIKQKELDDLAKRKKELQVRQFATKNQMQQYLNRKRQIELQMLQKGEKQKHRSSQARNQLSHARQLEQDYNYTQGKKVQGLRNRKDQLQFKKNQIQSNLQALREKKGALQAGQEVKVSRVSNSVLQNSAMYTFKQEPFEKVEEIRRLANNSGATEQRVKTINNIIDPKEQLILNRKVELETLKRQYEQNGGDDPNFFKTLQGLQNKYDIAQSKARSQTNPSKQPTPKPPANHRSYQPPSNPLSYSSTPAFYNPNSPYEVYQKFAVKPSQYKPKPQYLLPPNTFGNAQKLLLQQKIAPDQSIEQRILSTAMAQQYDSLQVLAKFPKDSEIYRLKLKQYEELTKVREDLVKQAHQQRMVKVRRQFELEKKLAEKDYQNDRFVDQMRMNMIVRKENGVADRPGRLQFSVMVDMVTGVPRQAQACKVNMSLYYQGQRVSTIRQTQPKPCEQRQTDHACRIYERLDCITDPRPGLLAVFEVLVSHQDAPDEFKTYSWGSVKITNQELKLGVANYEVSMFEPPYRPLSNSQVERLGNRVFLKVFEDRPVQGEYINPRNISRKTMHDIFNFAKSLQGTPTDPQKAPGQPQTSKPQPGKKATKSTPNGYQIRTRAIRTTQPLQSVWLQLYLYQQSQPLISKKGVPIEFHGQYKATVINTRTSMLKNDGAPMAQAKTNDSFKIYEDLRQIFTQRQLEIYLMIVLKDKSDGEEVMRGWHCLRLTNFNELREGLVRVNMFEPEIRYPPVDMNRVDGKLRDEVEFQILEFTPNPIDLNKFSNKSIQAMPSKKLPAEYQPSKPNSSGRSKPLNNSNTSILNPKTSKAPTTIQDNAFIDNPKTQFPNQQVGPLKTFDFKIDKVMHVPGGIGAIKVLISFVDKGEQNKSSNFIPSQELISDVGESNHTQDIGYIKQVVNEKLDNSTIVLIQLLSYNEFTGETGVLGTSIFPLVVTGENNVNCLVTGHYQLPVFWTVLEQWTTLADFYQYPKIPCLSLLISLDKNIAQTDSPQYSTGAYSTAFFTVDPLQLRLFNILVKRSRYTCSQSFHKYLSHKGITKKYTYEQIEQYLEQQLQPSKNMLSVNQLTPYDRNFGFTFTIDGLKKTNATNMYLITVCISPPAYYYSGNKMDLVFMTGIQLNSHKQFPVYNNNSLSYNEGWSEDMSFVVEVVEIQVTGKGEIEINLNSFGYVVFPVFEENTGKYLNAGSFELNLYDGDFPEQRYDELQAFHANRAIFENKNKLLKNPKICVRLLNNYFQSQFPARTMEDMAGVQKIAEKDMVKTLLPNNINSESFFEYLNKCIQQIYMDSGE